MDNLALNDDFEDLDEFDEAKALHRRVFCLPNSSRRWELPHKRDSSPDVPLVITHYTYHEYKHWPEDFRCEIIDGQIFMMAAPTALHQGLLVEIVAMFHNFLDDKPCRAYVAPYDVRLLAAIGDDYDGNEDDDTVVQPDMVVVCDEKKRFREGCHGAPDLVLEILSPSTRMKDLTLKKRRYREAGVREYWVLDPDNHSLRVYTLCVDDGKNQYRQIAYTEADTVQIGIFDGALSVNLAELFAKAARY
jgi:Uma2 family endonuclease